MSDIGDDSFDLEPDPIYLFLTTTEPRTSIGSIIVKDGVYVVSVKLTDNETLVVPLKNPTIYPLNLASNKNGENISVYSHHVQKEKAEGWIIHTLNPKVPHRSAGFWDITIMWPVLSSMADSTRAPNTVLTGSWTGIDAVSQSITISGTDVRPRQ
jgi:hypothetical protein